VGWGYQIVVQKLSDSDFVVLFQGITTGGLPTFIDVGNSFGAPAIIEDNLIHQVDSCISVNASAYCLYRC